MNPGGAGQQLSVVPGIKHEPGIQEDGKDYLQDKVKKRFDVCQEAKLSWSIM